MPEFGDAFFREGSVNSSARDGCTIKLLNGVIPGMIFIVTIVLSSIIIANSNNSYFSLTGYSQIGSVIGAALALYIIFEIMHMIAYFMGIPTYKFFITIMIFFGGSLALYCFALSYTSDASVNFFKSIGYANWRIENDFMKFEYDLSCQGLSLTYDNCSVCCDTLYTNKVTSVVSSARKMIISIIALTSFSAFLVIVIQIIYQISFVIFG